MSRGERDAQVVWGVPRPPGGTVLGSLDQHIEALADRLLQGLPAAASRQCFTWARTRAVTASASSLVA